MMEKANLPDLAVGQKLLALDLVAEWQLEKVRSKPVLQGYCWQSIADYMVEVQITGGVDAQESFIGGHDMCKVYRHCWRSAWQRCMQVHFAIEWPSGGIRLVALAQEDEHTRKTNELRPMENMYELVLKPHMFEEMGCDDDLMGCVSRLLDTGKLYEDSYPSMALLQILAISTL